MAKKKKVPMSQMYSGRQIHRLLNSCNDVFNEYGNIRFSAHYFYMRGLIRIGSFDEAISHAVKISDSYQEINQRGLISFILAEAYFYKGEFIKSMYFYKESNVLLETNNKYLKRIMRGLIYETSGQNCLGCMNKKNRALKQHVLVLRDRSFTADWDTFIEAIKENFDLSPTYYTNFSYEKIFRCQNISFANEFGEKLETDYFIVKFFNNWERSEDSIVTVIPIVYNGDLEYGDITHALYNKMESKKVISNQRKRIKETCVNKFLERQSKKN